MLNGGSSIDIFFKRVKKVIIGILYLILFIFFMFWEFIFCFIELIYKNKRVLDILCKIIKSAAVYIVYLCVIDDNVIIRFRLEIVEYVNIFFVFDWKIVKSAVDIKVKVFIIVIIFFSYVLINIGDNFKIK